MTNNALLYGLIAAAGLGLVWYATKEDSGTYPPGFQGGYQVNPGGNFNGYTNNSNVAVWVNFAGQLVNSIGQVIGYFTQDNQVVGLTDDALDWLTYEEDDAYDYIGAKKPRVTTSVIFLPEKEVCGCGVELPVRDQNFLALQQRTGMQATVSGF